MKNLLKNLASIAIMAAFVTGCQPSSPSPVVAVKPTDTTNPTDTTKTPPVPISPKVNAGEKCYEANLLFITPLCASVVVQVLNDSIGVKSIIGIDENDIKYNPLPKYLVYEKEFSNVLMLKVPDAAALALWKNTGKVYFTVKEFVQIQPIINNSNKLEWGGLFNCLTGTGYGVTSRIALKGAILSSYSTQSCKP